MRSRVLATVVTIVLSCALATRSVRASGAGDAGPARNRAAALLDNGEDAKAIEAFRDLVKRFPDSAPDRVNLAIALIHHNDLDGAEKELRAVLARSPEDLRAHYNLGLVLKKRGKNEEAAGEMARVAASPEGEKDATVHYNLGILYKRLRRGDEALAAFRKAVALRPEHASAHFQIYNELIQRGDKAAAAAELEEFKILQKATPEFQRNEAYLERGAFTRIDAPGGGADKTAKPSAPTAIRFEPKSGAGSAPPPQRDDAPAQPRPRSGAATLADFDGDGALDIAVAARNGVVRIHRQVTGSFAKVLATLDPPAGGKAEAWSVRALAAADIDNDGDIDLLIASDTGVRLLLNDGKGRFADATQDAGLAATAGASAAVWFDADRDGDLDLALGQAPARPSAEGALTADRRVPSRLFLNAGLFPETVASATKAAGGAGKARFLGAGKESALAGSDAIIAADLRGRGDADLVLLTEPDSGKGFAIARNLRGGRFREEPSSTGSPGRGAVASEAPSALAADLDADADLDLLVADPSRLLIHWNDGTGSFPSTPTAIPTDSTSHPQDRADPGLLAVALLDADGDGLLDVAALVVDRSASDTASTSGGAVRGSAGIARIALLRNEGERRFASIAAIPLPSPIDGPAGLLSGDLDGDGDPDLAVVTPDGPPIVLANVTKTTNRFLKVGLKGGKTNRAGVGARIEIRADRLFVSRESDGNPVIVGIGPRGRADAVRVVWTSGVTQDLIDVPAGPVKIEEKREFSGSCPFLYAWDGTTFRFIGEALSGAPVGFLRPDGVYEAPRPTEHLRLPPGALVPLAGRLSLRMTEEMRELTALDGVRLVAVDHPADVEVYSNERLTAEVEPFRYAAVAELEPPSEAREQALGATDGPDVTDALVRLDDRASAGFATLGPRLEGLSEPHVLALRFARAPSPPARLALVLDGWVAWTTSDVSRALLQAAARGTPPPPPATFGGAALPSFPQPWGPALEARSGVAPLVVVPDMGLPIGPSMLAPLPADVTAGGNSLEIRIGTSQAIYYDRIRLGRIVDAPLTVRELPPVALDLRWRGVAAARRARDDEPTRPDYDDISPLSPFPRFEEGTTPPGDVRDLGADVDGRYVVFGTGEEVALEFDATALAPPAPGTARTWFLVSTGYARDGDPNTQPLPWGSRQP